MSFKPKSGWGMGRMLVYALELRMVPTATHRRFDDILTSKVSFSSKEKPFPVCNWTKSKSWYTSIYIQLISSTLVFSASNAHYFLLFCFSTISTLASCTRSHPTFSTMPDRLRDRARRSEEGILVNSMTRVLKMWNVCAICFVMPAVSRNHLHPKISPSSDFWRDAPS